jgi:hypothetical protein
VLYGNLLENVYLSSADCKENINTFLNRNPDSNFRLRDDEKIDPIKTMHSHVKIA